MNFNTAPGHPINGCNGMEVMMQGGHLHHFLFLHPNIFKQPPHLLEKACPEAVSGGTLHLRPIKVLIGAIRRTPGHRLRKSFILVGVSAINFIKIFDRCPAAFGSPVFYDSKSMCTPLERNGPSDTVGHRLTLSPFGSCWPMLAS